LYRATLYRIIVSLSLANKGAQYTMSVWLHNNTQQSKPNGRIYA